MARSYTSQLCEAINMLVEKTDLMLQDRTQNAEQKARLELGFKRLIEVITCLERQQKVEFWLAEKLEETVTRLNTVLKIQNRAAGGIKGEFVENIERVARNVKIVGQAAEFIAEIMQVFSKAYRQSKAATTKTENGDTKTDKVDLTEILTQLNNLIETKVKSYASEGAKVIPSSQPLASEVEPAGENE